MIEFTCPCGRVYHVDDCFLGKRVRCDVCKAKYYLGKCGDETAEAGVPVIPVSLCVREKPVESADLAEGRTSATGTQAVAAPSREADSAALRETAEVEASRTGMDCRDAGKAGECKLPEGRSAIHMKQPPELQRDSPSARGATHPEDSKEVFGNACETCVQAGSWRRYWARILDFSVGYWLVYIIVCLVFQVMSSSQEASGSGQPVSELSGWLMLLGSSLLGSFLLDGVVYLLFGNTLGKWFMGLSVVDGQLRPLRGGEYFKRNLWVWIKGCGLGIPIVNIIAMSRQSQRIDQKLPTSYDEKLGTRVILRGCDTLKSFVGGLLLVLLFLLKFWERNL